jgi:hypothetical protein
MVGYELTVRLYRLIISIVGSGKFLILARASQNFYLFDRIRASMKIALSQ